MKKSILFAAVLCGAACANAQNYENGHEWVDLGLPSGIKWATCNVGAESNPAPTELGLYYAWGETESHDYGFSDNEYKFYDEAANNLHTKYNTTDGKTVLDPEDDAATQNWGGKWRMPTIEEWDELASNCQWTWVQDYDGTDSEGYLVKSQTSSNSIFFPMAGYSGYDGPEKTENGYYWSSTLDDANPDYAQHIVLGIVTMALDTEERYYGLSVRAVCEAVASSLATTTAATIHAENGRIVCDGDILIFDLLGRDVTRQNGQLNGIYIVKCGETAQKIVVR